MFELVGTRGMLVLSFMCWGNILKSQSGCGGKEKSPCLCWESNFIHLL